MVTKLQGIRQKVTDACCLVSLGGEIRIYNGMVYGIVSRRCEFAAEVDWSRSRSSGDRNRLKWTYRVSIRPLS